jgi:tetratricopeptide (TPR) repeat protein
MPPSPDRQDVPRLEHERQIYQGKVDAIRIATVRHDMTQGYVLTQYFYDQLILFEKDAAGLRDTIGEMVYSMDVDQQVHRARQIDFDKESDGDVLEHSKPRKLSGLDLAEARLADGDIATASAMARQALAIRSGDSLDSVADAARANFILARCAALTGHPDIAVADFQKTLGSSKEPRILAWSHIYLGRMLDLDCKRDEALSEYKLALAVRDGQLDTRLAAERGVKAPYAVHGHSCDEDDDDSSTDSGKPDTSPQPAAQPSSAVQKPQ